MFLSSIVSVSFIFPSACSTSLTGAKDYYYFCASISIVSLRGGFKGPEEREKLAGGIHFADGISNKSMGSVSLAISIRFLPEIQHPVAQFRFGNKVHKGSCNVTVNSLVIFTLPISPWSVRHH